MGGHRGRLEPTGFLLNGLLPKEAAHVTRVLDQERWSRAEARTAELLGCIQPSHPSEERRKAVVNYMQCLIMKCLSCQVFPFGSVPLKTYLPDGDIDLTAFSENQNLKDTWANEVRDMLESEEKSEDAEFRVRDVQYIQAEVKIIKCLVENIVVDISFNQLGGLCTLYFLEKLDWQIDSNHLFKRSIILIKAWCYYESRILGAHHGLISTYALETLVLYIFHVFDGSFAGPLEVLYRFLEFFSKFDWDNYCVSLWGPVPITSLPDMTADPPRKDGRESKLGKLFSDECSSLHAVSPGGQENQDLPFISKHFNIVDPLRTSNNLGRSVSKGNFFRIRSAFAFGAQQLARLLHCPEENLIQEVDQFFTNTWDRHGKGCCPDAPSSGACGLRSSDMNQINGFDSLRNYSSSNKVREYSISHDSEAEASSSPDASHVVTSLHGSKFVRRKSITVPTSAVSRTQVGNTYANSTKSMASDQNHEILPNNNIRMKTDNDTSRSTRSDTRNEVHASHQFARTHSSPELTCTSSEVSRGKSDKASEAGNGQTAPSTLDTSRRNLGTVSLDNNAARLKIGVAPSSQQSLFDQSIDTAVDSGHKNLGDSGLVTTGEEFLYVDQEEQGLMNIIGSRGYNFSGQVHVPFNLNSAHPPFPMPPSMLFPLGYGQGLIPLPSSQYVPSVGMASNGEEVDGDLVSTALKQECKDHVVWPMQDADSVRGYDHSNRTSRAQLVKDAQEFISAKSNSVCPSKVSSSDGSSLKDNGLNRESRGLSGESFSNNFQNQRIGDSNGHPIPSSKFLSTSQATTSRTKLSSENCRDGTPKKNFKSARDNQGKKSAPFMDPSVVYGLDENGWQHESESTVCVSSQANDDIKEWNLLSTVGMSEAESTISGSFPSSSVQTCQIPGYELALPSRSNSTCSVDPLHVGPKSQQSANDNNGVLPFAFYPTGPPVPFLTMIPVYNLPRELGIPRVPRNSSDRKDFNNHQKSQLEHSGDPVENLCQSEIFYTSDSGKPSEEHKSDILSGDFTSHWQNLHYGRFCQNDRQQKLYTSPVAPQMSLEQYFPWDGPRRPPPTNMNLPQLKNYTQVIPVSSMQSSSSKLTGVYQQHADEIPRYRGGTGTYLPTPKMSFWDRQSSNTRSHRGNRSHDRTDQRGESEGNWNMNSKSRFVGRGRNQFEKPSMRGKRGTASNNRTNKPWDSSRYDSLPSSYSHNGSSSFSNYMNNGSTNMAYSMYPLPVVNPNGVSSSGAAVPPVVMWYPYDHNMAYGSPAEHLERGSFGPMHFSGVDEASHISEGSSGGINEEQDFLGDSGHSSPFEPSSPQPQR